jgi:hypothetical protein
MHVLLDSTNLPFIPAQAGIQSSYPIPFELGPRLRGDERMKALPL